MDDVFIWDSACCLLLCKPKEIHLKRLNKAIALLNEPKNVDLYQRISASEVVCQRPIINMYSYKFLRICSRIHLDSTLVEETVYKSIRSDMLDVAPDLEIIEDKCYWIILNQNRWNKILETLKEEIPKGKVMNISEMATALKNTPMADQFRKLKQRCIKINTSKLEKIEENGKETKKDKGERETKKTNRSNQINEINSKKEKDQTNQFLQKTDSLMKEETISQKVARFIENERKK